MTSPATPPLTYAPRPSRFARRRTAWAVAVAVVTAAVVAPRWWPPLWRHLRLLYWQHRCVADALPANTVAWNNLGGSRRVPAWDALGTLLSPPGYRPGAILFLHKLKTPSGDQLLVCVVASNIVTRYSNSTLPHVVVTVVRPGTLVFDPVDVTDVTRRFFAIDDAGTTTLYAGTVDSADPTHFVMLGLDEFGSPLTFDGRLTDDDRVSIERRPTPGR